MPGGKIEILVEPDLRGFPAKLGAGLRAAGAVATAAGRAIGVAMAAGTVAAAAGFKQIIALGVDYQNQLNTLQAVTGATAQQMAQVGARAQELGSDLSLPATSAADAATAMTELAKGGLSVEQAMAAAKGTLQLAAAAQIDAGTAAQIQANALNTFNLSAEQAGHVADVLAGAANAATGEITDFASAFQSGGSVAAQFGMTIGETATALALFANNGIQGSDAGTLLKASLLALTDQGKPAQQAIKALGLSIYDAKGQFVGFPALMDQLRAAAQRMTPEQYQAATATLFGSDAIRMAGIAAKTTSQDWQQLAAQVTKAGSAQEIAAAKARGVGGAFDAIQSQLETIGLQIFNVIAQPLEDGLRVIAQFLDDASSELGDFIGSGGLQKAFDDTVAGIEAFGQRIGVTWDGIVQFVTEGIAKIQEVAGNVVAFLAPIGQGLVAVFDSFRQSGGVFDIAATAIGHLVDGFVALTGILRPIGELIGGVLQLFADLPAPIQSFILAMAAFKGLPMLADALGTSIGKLLTTSGPLGTVLGQAIDGLIGGFGRVGEAAKGAVSPVRQFIDEMRLQKGLAEQSGKSISTLEAAQAAYETTTIGSVAAVRELIDAFQEIRAGAEAAGEPVSAIEAAIRALGEQNETVGEIVAAFDAGAAAGERFGARIQELGTNAATFVSEGLVAAVDAVARGFTALPGLVSAAGQAMVGAFRAGVQLVADIPGRVVAAGAAIRTGIGAAAQFAGEAFQAAANFVAEFGGQIRDALGNISWANIRAGLSGFVTALSSGFTSAIAAARAFGTGIVTAVGAAFTGLRASATAAVAALRAAFSGLSFSSMFAALRTSITSLGTAIRTGLTAAFTAIPGLVSGALSSLRGFGSAVGGIFASFGTIALRGIGGLINMLGGPLGVALLAAQFGLQAMAKAQQEAAAAAQEHQAKLERLTQTLDAYSGAITQATIDEKAHQLAQDGHLAKAKELGINVRDLTLAHLGDADALQRVRQQLDAHVASQIAASEVYKGSQRELEAMGITLQDLTAAAQGNQPALDKISDAIKRIADLDMQYQMQAMIDGMLKAGAATAELGKELGISNGKLEKIQEQIRLAAEASANFDRQLNFLSKGLGGMKDVSDATETMANGLRELANSANLAAQAAAKDAAELNGVKAGAEAAAQSMQKSREAFIQAAQAAGLSAEEAARVADSIGLIPSAARIIFETNATGVTAELITVGEQVKAVPDAKSVTVNTLSDEAIAKLRSFGLEVEKLPNGQSRILLEDAEARQKFLDFQALISTTTGRMLLDMEPAQALGKLQEVVDQANSSLGRIQLDGDPTLVNGKIQQAVTFADGSRGTITLDGNPDPATGKINAVVTYGNGQHTTITIDPRDLATPVINSIPRQITTYVNIITRYGSIGGPELTRAAHGGAIGGIVKGMDSGGVLGMARGGRVGVKLTPMRGGIAQIVPPNTWRVIGDRIKDDEAFIPINKSRRSRRIFEETARRMGYEVVRRFAEGGIADRARGFTRSVVAAALSRNGMNLSPLAAELAQLRRDLTATARQVAITNQFFTEPSARDSDTVARVQRRQAALGLFG